MSEYMKLSSPSKSGFTLIELLVVIGIIGVLASVVMMSISDSRLKGRDTGRKSQITEILKALELYYGDGGLYPTYGVSTNTGGIFSGIQPSFISTGSYITAMPPEANLYYYCVSADQKSILLAVNTEADKGGSDYCHVIRGPGPTYGCTYTGASPQVAASSPCYSRF